MEQPGSDHAVFSGGCILATCSFTAEMLLYCCHLWSRAFSFPPLLGTTITPILRKGAYSDPNSPWQNCRVFQHALSLGRGNRVPDAAQPALSKKIFPEKFFSFLRNLELYLPG
jgi:hypothetical protein